MPDLPTPDLRACPFCGGTDLQSGNQADPGDHPFWVVICFGCEADGPASDSKAEAVAAWNRRVGDAADIVAFRIADLPTRTLRIIDYGGPETSG